MKRIRTSEKRRVRNRTIRSQVRTAVKTARAAGGDALRTAVAEAKDPPWSSDPPARGAGGRPRRAGPLAGTRGGGPGPAGAAPRAVARGAPAVGVVSLGGARAGGGVRAAGSHPPRQLRSESR